jgi:hypothetical protein
LTSFRLEVKAEQVLEEGPYQAVVEHIEKTSRTFGDGEKERLFWTFYIPAEDRRVVGFSSLSSSPKAKCTKWAKDILGVKEDNFNWGPEDLKGKSCTVVLGIKEDADGDEKNIVEKVKPPKKGKDQPVGGKHSDDPDLGKIPF